MEIQWTNIAAWTSGPYDSWIKGRVTSNGIGLYMGDSDEFVDIAIPRDAAIALYGYLGQALSATEPEGLHHPEWVADHLDAPPKIMRIQIWQYFNAIYDNAPQGWIYCAQLYCDDDYPVDFGIAEDLEEARSYFLASHGQFPISYGVPDDLIEALEVVDADFLNPDQTRIPT